MKHYKDITEYMEKNINMFDRHIATKHELGGYMGTNVIVNFRKDDTLEGSITFVYIDGYLHIQGDYGCASFTWHNPKNSIGMIARFAKDTDYFLSKMVSGGASEIPNALMARWDQDECIKSMEGYIAEEQLIIEEEFENWRWHTESYTTWASFLNENGEGFIGSDDYLDFYEAGVVRNERCFVWAYALIKAIEQLQEAEGTRNEH